MFTEEATPAAANAASSTSRSGAGRPKADLLGQTAEEVRSFSASTEHDVLWWGRESATKLKDLMVRRKQIDQRIRNCHDAEGYSRLKAALKRLNMIVALVEAASKHGVDSDRFMAAYEV